MQTIKYFIGFDISADDFTASCIISPDNPVFSTQKFSNNIDGTNELIELFDKNNIKPSEAILCMEATGVYSEKLCYFLASKGFTVSVEAPHKIKNKIKDSPRKKKANRVFLGAPLVNFVAWWFALFSLTDCHPDGSGRLLCA